MSDAVGIVSASQEVTNTDAKAPFDNPDADVIIRSSNNVDFWVFRSFLSSVSNVFKDMFSIPQGPADVTGVDQGMKQGLHVIPITEDSLIVERLLKFCYPNILTSVPELETIEDILPMLEVAIKYDIEKLESRMRNALFTLPVVAEKAMQAFVVACQHGWEEEMKIAAMHTLTQPAWDRLYVVELESITGGDLYRLQKYRLKCTTAAIKVAQTFGWIKRDNIDWMHCNTCQEPAAKIEIGWMVYRLGSWWVDYMEKAAKELAKIPRGKTVLGSTLIDSALQRANRCQRCSQRSETDVRFKEFCKVFAAQIEQAISEVTLDIKRQGS